MRVELPRLRREWTTLAAELPSEAGAYVLELQLRRPRWLDVGRLGRVRLPAGWLRYYGSARGGGGLRGRLSRHLRGAADPEATTCHWHVDALLHSEARLRALELHLGAEAEHQLVARDLVAGWRVCVVGFGSSDCERCPAHLLTRERRGRVVLSSQLPNAVR
jgi:Uri superfamily endonuclease